DRAGNVYTITSNILLRSTNAGDTWDTIKSPNAETVTWFSADEKRYYVTTTSGIYTSIDLGKTWKRVLNGIPTGDYRTITAGNNGVLFARWNGTSTSAWYRSSDYGQSWRNFSTPGDRAYKVAIRKDNKALLYGGDEVIYYDNDSTITRLEFSGNRLAAV